MVELDGLSVIVERVVHQPEMVTPPDRPHCFAYFITILNGSAVAVTIKGRKWVVKEEDGNVTAVEGDGVVGQFPLMAPGKSFNYHSFHLFKSRWAAASGSYLGVDENGRAIFTRIPEFRMVVPRQPLP